MMNELSADIDRLDRAELRAFVRNLLERHLVFVRTDMIREALLVSIHTVAAGREMVALRAEAELFRRFMDLRGEHAKLDPTLSAEKAWRRSRDAVEQARDRWISAGKRRAACERTAERAWSSLQALWDERDKAREAS